MTSTFTNANCGAKRCKRYTIKRCNRRVWFKKVFVLVCYSGTDNTTAELCFTKPLIFCTNSSTQKKLTWEIVGATLIKSVIGVSFISRLSTIVRIKNVVLNRTVLVNRIDVSTICAVVIFGVQVSCITSVDGIKLWL